MTSVLDCPHCGAGEGVEHRETCPRHPNGPALPTPPPAPIQQRMLRLWIHGSAVEASGMQVDVPMPPDFNIAMWWQAVKGTGHFITMTLDFFVPADRIICACTFTLGGPEPAKVMPFKAIDGGKTP